MDFYKILGIASTGVLITIGIVKLELIKALVKKVTTDKESINLFAIIFLVVISIIPAVIGFTIPEANPDEKPEIQKTVAVVQQTTQAKTKEEVYLEAGKDAIIIGKELYDQHQDNKKSRDSVFLANRQPMWVYQIGYLMDNEESILKLYKKLKTTQDICLFKDKGKFMLFRNKDFTKKEIDDSLESFKSQIGLTTVTKVDLMIYCNSSKEKYKKIKSERLGTRRDRIEIDCYTVGK